jgi:hypothetical protein
MRVVYTILLGIAIAATLTLVKQFDKDSREMFEGINKPVMINGKP